MVMSLGSNFSDRKNQQLLCTSEWIFPRVAVSQRNTQSVLKSDPR